MRYFIKRTPCRCLKTKYSNARAKQRNGKCSNCEEVTDRKLLPLCGGCKYTSFCDIECARSHWPDHKSWCLGIQIRQIRREHLQSWCKDSDKATVAGKECLLSMLALVVRFTPMSVIEAGSIVASYSKGGGMPVHIYNDFMTTGDVDEFLQLASSFVCCFLPCT